MNIIKFIVVLSIFINGDLCGQICPLCEKERLVKLLNGNPHLRDYVIHKDNSKPE